MIKGMFLKDRVERKKYALLTIVVVAPLLLLLTVTVIAHRSSVRSEIAGEEVRKSYRLIGQLDGILSTTKDAETGYRGFLITNDLKYLAPYQTALSVMPRQLNQLCDTLCPHPPQLERFTRVKQLVEAKFIYIAGILKLHATDPAAAVATVRAGEGRVIMEQLRAFIGQLKAEETDRLDQRLEEIASQKGVTDLALLAIVVVDVITLGSTLFILRKLRYLRRMITICAWTHQIKYEGKWVGLEQYFKESFGFYATHSISEEGKRKFLAEHADAVPVELHAS
jgi:CHASE3 domain sensor protein